MSASNRKSKNAVGFLTILESSEHGISGGYLLLNSTGRPIEFHCTAPVHPSRTQEILYGATLKPYLFGEIVGQTLLSQTQTEPLFVCTNVVEVATARPFVSYPIVVLLSENNVKSAPSLRIDGPTPGQPVPAPLGMVSVQLMNQPAAVLADHPSDRQLMNDRCTDLHESFDFHEPFERIRDAVEEAQNE